MPLKIKIIMSVIITLVAIAGYVFQDWLGHVAPKYAVIFVGVAMVFGMWIFPEVSGKKGNAQTPRKR